MKIVKELFLKMKSFRFLLCIFFLLPFLLFAQQDTSKSDSNRKHTFPKQISEASFIKDYTAFTSADTSLTEIQRYKIKHDLGNLGLPIYPLHPPLPSSSTGFSYRPDFWYPYCYTREKISFFSAPEPFTKLDFLIGQAKELGFSFLHTQNVNRNLNFAASFLRIRSEGMYKRQRSNHNSFSLSSNYRSPKRKYFLLSGLIYNKLNAQENGGIESDSILQDPLIDRRTIPVNLSSAQRTNHHRSFFMSQFFNLGKKEPMKKDTQDYSVFIPRHSIVHSFSWEEHSYLYTDDQPREGYYPIIRHDTIKTFDSVSFYKITNELRLQGLSNASYNKMKLKEILSLKHEYVRLKNYVDPVIRSNTRKDTIFSILDSAFESLTGSAEIFSSGIPYFTLSLRGEYVFSGPFKNNFSSGLIIRKYWRDSLSFFLLEGKYSYRNPDMIYNYYNSNHHYWFNEFSAETSSYAELAYHHSKINLRAGLRAYSLYNSLYIDSNLLPAQFSGNIVILNPFIEKVFRLGRFVLSNRISYNYITEPDIARFPDIIGYHSLYYENTLFKKVFLFQAGIDVFYFSSFYAKAYDPALGMFYIQNKKQTGKYPFFDAFINFKIKTARVFIKYEHLNSDLMGSGYAISPGYPLPGRAVKLGISWMMFE